MMPLISICIPVYGVERYIEKCCHSLFGQSYSNIEYIFVDDCTPDNSIGIIERVLTDYPKRKGQVKIIHHEENKGLSSARNTAISAVTGQYLMHVDSDDYLDLNVVESLVGKVKETNADVVLYDMRYIYADRQYTVHQFIPATKEECVKNTLIYKMRVCVWGGLYLSSLFKDCGVKFIEGLNFGEDYVVKPRILYYAHKIVHCEGCYYNYVQYNTSSYTLSYRSKNIDDLIKAISILDDFFKGREDYELYQQALVMAHLLVKSKLLVAICLHRNSVWNKLPEVADLYNGLKTPKDVSFAYQLTLYLARHKLYNSLYIYVRSGFWIKQFYKKYFRSSGMSNRKMNEHA